MSFGQGDTFSGGDHCGIRTLDVSATIDEAGKQLSVFVVNRSPSDSIETTLSLDCGEFGGPVMASAVNGPDIKAENSFDQPEQVTTSEAQFTAAGKEYVHLFEPHSVTALVFDL